MGKRIKRKPNGDRELYDNGKRERNENRGLIILVSVTGVFVLAILLFLFLFRVKTVTVEGNIHYTEEEIKAMVMDDFFAGNSLIFSLKKGTQEMEHVPFMETIQVEMASRNEIRLVVTEKNIVGYLQSGNAYWYFDRDGMVVEKADEPVPTAEERIAAKNAQNTEEGVIQSEELPVKNFVPLVEGLSFEQITVGEVLEISNPGIFNALSSINQMINKDNIPPDKVVFDEESNITLVYGEIEVWLGKDEHLEEKMNTLASIMPEMDGLSGVLHLEDYDSLENGVIFEKNE